MAGQYYPLLMQSGIQRDGTQFSSNKWIDGNWMRFYRGRPRTMEGYKQLLGNLPNVLRGMIIVPNSPNFDIYMGDQNSLKVFTMDQFGNVIGPTIDRTPVLFAGNSDNNWTFDLMFSTVDNTNIILAYASQDLSSISSQVETPIYYGDSLATTPLIPTGINTAGGILVLHPYLFIFGNDGEVSWTTANNPSVILNSARVTSSKIIAGATTRGGNTSPAGILWSLDSVIRVTNVGPTASDFNFDTITDESSILSKKSIIEYDGIYYWVATDRWLSYNGTVTELPNNTSLAFFFQNLNYAQRQKVWATKVSEWGEIWWHFPMGNSTECNHAVVYNVREQTWYDTVITRSCGDFDQTFQYPIWADNTLNINADYTLWQHETGQDQNVNGNLTAINKYIESGDISYCAVGPDGKFNGVDRLIDLYDINPDFLGTPDVNNVLQTGNINFVANGRRYPQSSIISSDVSTFTNTTERVDTRFQARLMTLKFSSNQIGGFFEMGQVLLNMRLGDGRP